jgi:Uma2 family endonuclease
MTEAHHIAELQPLVVRIPPSVELTPAQFRQICRVNPDWRLELTAQGDVVVMSPTGGETGAAGARITAQLIQWADEDDSGVAFDSSTGFVLPNGAIRSPDASWVARVRLAKLSRRQKRQFLPLCPDFVIELRSPTDPLAALQTKLREYMANGARLGWLIDPEEGIVYVYRAHAAMRRLARPSTISAEPLLPGFALNLRSIWQPRL